MFPLNRVEISEKHIDPPPWRIRLKRFVVIVLKYMNVRRCTISILLCNDDYIKTLNSTYREKDQVTDVLSFIQQQNDVIGGTKQSEPKISMRNRQLGDIVISLERAETQAESFGVTLNDEIKRLSVHGLLHLLGMDHDDEDENDSMIGVQESILEKYSEVRVV